MTDKALSVSQLNSYIKMLMESDDVLNYVTIRGEISNFKRHSSGHLYFTLKDDKSEIAAVMFRAAASRLNFSPKSGDKVVAYGKVSVYEVSGKYQVYVNAMTDDGAGALYAEYQRLLEKLRAQGLFDASRKKPIPAFPCRVGIVTSPTGAAIRDMINVTGRRYPTAELVICPSSVQGAEAPEELRRSLMLLDAVGGCDVIIIGRGGGSAEDLWAFNDEALVRAVAAANTPIISAVGHETDTTLCDYAADLRAPTPSAAAELAVPDRGALLQSVDEKAVRMRTLLERRIATYRSSLDAAAKQLALASPTEKLKNARSRINKAEELMSVSVLAALDKKRLMLAASTGRLEAINPLAVISRGYSVTQDADGRVVSSTSQVEKDQKISVLVSDGSIDALVTGKRGK
ncbi:MAG: exodeoxyribonuclease VII large subunit [Ruminococcaceae bacterium]|nr:exodeoxyribonuclease VII large subunit [Oscillospiraceae bacterium]